VLFSEAASKKSRILSAQLQIEKGLFTADKKLQNKSVKRRFIYFLLLSFAGGHCLNCLENLDISVHSGSTRPYSRLPFTRGPGEAQLFIK
jgi:hypothetical protein